MSGFTLCSLVQSWNATSVVGTALTGEDEPLLASLRHADGR